jgi:hypothetical protein
MNWIRFIGRTAVEIFRDEVIIPSLSDVLPHKRLKEARRILQSSWASLERWDQWDYARRAEDERSAKSQVKEVKTD